MDTRQASLGVALTQTSLYPFSPAPPGTSPRGRMRPGLQAWPATGGAVIAPLQIARASAQHFDTVLGLIEDARSWLWSKDTDQWDKPWPDPAARDERVLAGLRNEKTWIVWDGDIAAATITITTRRNNAVWAKPACTADLAERAVFVHRLITSRKYAGLGPRGRTDRLGGIAGLSRIRRQVDQDRCVAHQHGAARLLQEQGIQALRDLCGPGLPVWCAFSRSQ